MPSTSTDRLNGLSTSVAVKAPCRTVATSNITLSGLQTISGVAVVENDRVLVKAQSVGSENGIYLASTGSWTRAADFDGNRDVVRGTLVPIAGTGDSVDLYEVTTSNPITIGATSIAFAARIGENIRWDRTDAEIAAGVTPGNYAHAPGLVERYGNNTVPGVTDMSAALALADLQSLESGGIPVSTNQILHIATETVVSGRFVSDRKQCFTTTSDIYFGPGAVEAILPEWFGAKADAAIDGSSGTLCTAAFAAAIIATTTPALIIPIHPISCGPGNYLVGNLEFPAVTALRGTGRHTTNFVAAIGTSGAWFTDRNGSATKIIMEGFAMYGRGLPAITHGIHLGYNGVQHGVEGYLRDLWVIDMPNAVGIDIDGNVGFYGTLAAYTCATGIRITGIANVARELVAYSCTTRGVDLNLTNVDGCEIEAPGDSCIPLYLTGNAAVRGLIISLANGTTISHLIELAANATTWELRQFCLAFGNTPAGITVTNGNIKRADGSYCGGNATAGSRNGEGHYSSESAGQRLQSFVLRIINTAGTMQHRISDASESGAAGNFAACISGASPTLANTPTGSDASTAFVSGGKIGSATASIFWLNTASQKIADGLFMAQIVANTTDTALTVTPIVASIDINGVTRARLGLQLLDAATGVAVSISTANFDAGELVKILFYGYLSQ